MKVKESNKCEKSSSNDEAQISFGRNLLRMGASWGNLGKSFLRSNGRHPPHNMAGSSW
jgi:hypothetical protein